jgi:NitT/TauT family transport system substrate-binding protein
MTTRLQLAVPPTVLLALLSACGGPAQAPASTTPGASASAPASTRAAAPLRVAQSTTSANQLPVWVAADGGLFERNGLRVTNQVITGGSTTTAALLSGQVQIVVGGGSEALSAIANGADLAIVAVTVPKYEYVFEVASSVKQPSDLKGQHLGVGSIGGNADTALHAALRQYGLDPDRDVVITATGAQTTSLAALNSGAVAGTMISPPDNLTAEKQGAHPLLNMADLPVYTATGVVYMQRSFLGANRAVVQSFVDSLIQATARVKRDRAYAISVMKQRLKSDDDAGLNAAYDVFAGKIFPALPFPKAEFFQEAVNTLGKSNEKVRSFDINTALDSSFVQSAADRGLDR